MADKESLPPQRGSGRDGRDRSLPPPVEPSSTELRLWDEVEAPAPLGAGSGGSPAMHPANVLRFKGTIVLVFLLFTAAASAAIWLLMTPMYRATAAVYVSPIISRMVFKTDTNGVMPLYRQHLNTQAHLLRSPEVLDRVLDQDAIRQSSWYRRPPKPLWGDPPGNLDRLRKSVEVTPSGESEVITVSMRAPNAREAKLIVDTVVQEYQRRSRVAGSQDEAEVYQKLMEQHTQLQKTIDGLNTARYNLSRELGTLTPEELRSNRSLRLSELEQKKDEVQRQIMLTRYELEFLPQRDPAAVKPATEQPAKQTSVGPPPEARYTRDQEWRQLNVGVQQRRHELELARMHFGESHPKLIQAKADVEHAERLLSERAAQLDEEQGWSESSPESPPIVLEGEPPPNSPRFLQQQLRRLEYEFSLLSQEVDAQRERVNSAGDVAQRLASYDEELRQKRELSELFRRQLQAIETESKAPAHIRVAPASEPSVPDRDRRLLLTVMAAAGGLMGGLAVAYMRSAFDPTIRGAGDVTTTLRAPFLGRLPAWSAKTDLMSDANPLLTEYTRMVRTSLLERLRGTDKIVLLITSCSSRSGKTGVSVLLGRSLAQLGKRVLLVEADLHRPSLAPRLRLPAGPGLMDVLCGKASDQQAILPTETPRFDVLPAGDRPPEFDAELLANGEFAACLRRWGSTYHYILLDSPPVLPVADARILARHADGTMMVLRSSHCRKPDVVQAYADLAAAGATLLGTVLVGGEMEVSDAYHDGYARYEPRRLLEAEV